LHNNGFVAAIVTMVTECYRREDFEVN
jgi:hypothetical protein